MLKPGLALEPKKMSSESPASIKEMSASRLDSIDLLRGFACLWVLYCHAHASWGHLATAPGVGRILTIFVGIGGTGVDLFVVVSGFCLFYPILQRSKTNLPQHSTKEFYRRRLKRICPVYFSGIVFALAVLGLGFHISNNRGLADLVPYALFIQNMMLDYTPRVNGPLWSVALEMQLYLLFPLFVFLLLRGKSIWLVILLIMLSVLASLGNARGYFTGRSFDPSTSLALPARAIQFVLGMIAASIIVHDEERQRAILFALSPVAAILALLSVARFQQHNPLRHLGLAAWGVVGAALVVALIQWDRAHGATPRALIPLQRVGLISFSVYVVHFPILLAMQPMMSRYIQSPIQAIEIYTMTGLPLTLLVATILFLFVERYTLNAGKSSMGAVRIEAGPASRLTPSDMQLLSEAVHFSPTPIAAEIMA